MIQLILIALFLILLPAFLLAFVMRKPIELFIAIMLPFYSICLYLFGLINCLVLGVYSIVAFILGLLFYAFLLLLIQQKKNKTRETINNLKNCLSPGGFIFIIGILFASYMSYGRLYSGTDEFSHWGRVVKLLFIYDQLPIKNDDILKLVMFKSYPLGTSLIGYLFAKIYSSFFCDCAHMFSMNVLILSQLILFIHGTKWKDAFGGLICQICMVAICITFSSPYAILFTNVLVDPLLGITLASCMYSSIIMSQFTWKQSLYLTIFLSNLILIKQPGFGLAFLVLIAPTFLGLASIIQKINKYQFRGLLKSFSFFMPHFSLLFYYLHKKSLSGIQQNFSGEKITLKALYDGWHYNSNEVFSEIFEKMIDQIFFLEKKYFVIPISYFMIILFCIVVVYFLFKENQKRNRVLLFVPYLIIFGFLIYSITLFLYYNFSFSAYEGVRLASFDRYISTFMIFTFITIMGLLYQHIMNECYTNNSRFISTLFFVSPILFSSKLAVIKSYFDPISNQSMMEFSSVFDQIVRQSISENDKFFFISQASKAKGFEGLVSAVYFPLNYKSQPLSWGEPQFDGDIWSRNIANKTINSFFSDYQYCYMYRNNQYFVEHYSQYFEPLINKPNVLYKVLDGKFHPVPLKRFVFDFSKASLFDVTKQEKSSVEYSSRMGYLLARMMASGNIELKPKTFCPLWNGKLNKLSFSFDKIYGQFSFVVKINGAIAYESELNESSNKKIIIDLPDIELDDLLLCFSGESEYSSFIIREVRLDYSDFNEDNQNQYSVHPLSLTSNALIQVITSDSFSVRGSQNVIKTLKPALNPIPDNGHLVLKGRILNRGQTTPTIYIGWSPFSESLKEIRPIHVQPIDSTYTVLLSDLSPDSNNLIVKDASNWVVDKESFVFFDASDDYSDLPNFSDRLYGNIKVTSITKQEDGTWNICIDKSVKSLVKQNTGVRLHKRGGSYLYSSTFKLLPGEEKNFESVIKGLSLQNGYDIKQGWPMGSKYASIVILSYSGTEDDIVINELELQSFPSN
jgi:hypothetical protein